MKKNFRERTRDFFIKLGQKNSVLRVFAMIGLAASMLIFRFAEYCRTGGKRFACALFILCCFFTGNSFAYPVFYMDRGFISEEEPLPSAAQESDIISAQGMETESQEFTTEELLQEAEGFDDTDYHDLEQTDKYSVDDILNENQDLLMRTGEQKETADIVKEQNEEIKFDAKDWKIMLINKQHPIPEDYTFTLGNIKTMKGTMKCDERIIEELLSMMQDAKKDGVNLAICSPYRDLKYQEVLFDRKIVNYMNKGMSYLDAYKVASQAVTLPGASEHQVGLAIDIVCDTYQLLDEGFGNTDAGIWLSEHCSEYGFILRYPKGKEYITSIEYEPWHFRYVGKDAAAIIMEQGLCLEEFWDQYL